MRWLDRIIHNAMRRAERNHNEKYVGGYDTAPHQKPRSHIEDVVADLSSTVGQIFRIDNGFLVALRLGGDLGGRGNFVYAKDAQEVAEQIIAHEIARKMGVSHASAGMASPYPSSGVPIPAANFKPTATLHSKI